jgi:hypothetical protein
MSEYRYLYDDDDDLPTFCDCGVTLDHGEEQCPTCANAPHGLECGCPECEAYWRHVAHESALAAYRANRALVCSCGWTGAFIEHHNSEAYGRVAQVGCEVTYREPRDERQRAVRKVWSGSEWRQAGEEV